MIRARRPARLAATMAGLAAAMLVFGGLGLLGQPRPGSTPPAPSAGLAGAEPGQDAVSRSIAALQARLQQVPGDAGAWASLGLAYVQQARIAADPSIHAKAGAALDRSWSIEPIDNYLAAAGRSTLAAARHDFHSAAEWARRGLEINPANAMLWGALADAEVQLGNYDEAFEATQRMVDLSPDTASLARASYAWELRGDVAAATALMERASDAAFTASDRAFTRHLIGELAFNAGDPERALAEYEAGLAIDAGYAPLRAGLAKAQAALGRYDEAVANYRSAIDRLPELAYALELAELLEFLGRTEEATTYYQLFGDIVRIQEANGQAPGVEVVLFEADHGDTARAVRSAEATIAGRSIVDMADAYAWALHRAGRSQEALAWSERALALGTRNAAFHHHAGTIRLALGDEAGARDHLTAALDINPHFSPTRAREARDVLARLRNQA